MYPPQQFAPGDSIKPDGSLGLTYIAGALRQHGYEVRILDACAGDQKYSLDETFFRKVNLPNGLRRIGMSLDQILNEASHYDVIGITSVFTPQTTRVIEVIKGIKSLDPGKFIILGGVNARAQLSRFFESGADVVCLSDAETTILEIGDILRRGQTDLSGVDGIAFKRRGKVIVNPMKGIEADLDKLPFPAWDLLPLERYWEVGRPRGGSFSQQEEYRFASLMTSRGCQYKCLFCHVSEEDDHSIFGNLKKFRVKSHERVLQELRTLKQLGVQQVFFEDDTLLGNKKRAIGIFREVRELGLALRDINGVNVRHLFKKVNGKLKPDIELLEAMVEAGFQELSFPFQSGSERIQKKYCSNKVDLKLDTISLLEAAKNLGLTVSAGFMIGFPDETYDEMTETIMLAKKHIDMGLEIANLRCVVPYPGSKLFEQAVAGGYIDRDFDPDKLVWLYPTMKNTIIHPDVLRYVNKICWMLLNPSWRINQIKSLGR